MRHDDDLSRILGMTPEQISFVDRQRMSRRSMLRLSGAGALAAVVGVSSGRVSASGRRPTRPRSTPPGTTTMPDPGTVTMLGWQGYDDETARAAFDQAGGVLNTTYIGNNDEILARLRGGQGTFDVVTPNAAFLPALVIADVLEPLDYDALPNTAGYFAEFYKPEWNTFDGSTWGAPVEWGNGPMVYRPDLIDEVPTSWMQLAEPELEGMVAMWDDGFGHIVVMAKTLGFPEPNRLTSDQLDQVVDALTKIRNNSRVVAPSLGDLADVLARGEAAVTTQSWQGVATFVRDAGQPAEWTVPEEGTWGWNDHYCIAKGAGNVEGAYQFIDTMIAPEANATITNTFYSGTPVEASVPFLTDEVAQIFDYSDITGELDALGFYALPPLEREGDIQSLDDWNAAWSKVKG
jgi:spermidine/putrescine transport system substrate-binding protein